MQQGLSKSYGSLEIVHTDGLRNILNYIELKKLLVSIGIGFFLCAIVPHRTLVTCGQAAKEFINSHTDAVTTLSPPRVNLDTLATLKNNADPNYQACINERVLMSDLTIEQIKSKIISYDLKMKEKLANKLFMS